MSMKCFWTPTVVLAMCMVFSQKSQSSIKTVYTRRLQMHIQEILSASFFSPRDKRAFLCTAKKQWLDIDLVPRFRFQPELSRVRVQSRRRILRSGLPRSRLSGCWRGYMLEFRRRNCVADAALVQSMTKSLKTTYEPLLRTVMLVAIPLKTFAQIFPTPRQTDMRFAG